GVQRREQGVLHDDPGQREHQVLVRRAGDRAAEHVREQQDEHHRLDAEVHQLQRVVLDLYQRPPGQRKRLAQPLNGTHPNRQCSHATLPSSSRASARRPVSDRNTSSRLEPRRASSATSTPASSSRRTSAGSTAGSATAALTVVSRTSGAAARSSRRRMPPEYPLTARSAAASRRKSASSSRARWRAAGRDRPTRRPMIMRFSRPVSDSSTDAYWPARPMTCRTRCASRTTSYPPTRAYPP